MNLRRGPLSPRLALGCAQLGNLYRARGDDEAAAILEEAWNAGIRQFDTAPHYGLGLSERRLDTLLPACVQYDVRVLNAAIFNSGILAQRHPDAGARFEYAAASREVLERARALARVCEAHGTSLLRERGLIKGDAPVPRSPVS